MSAADAPIVEMQDVGFHYPSGPAVLDGVSFSIRPRDFACVVGPNGGGKTTLVRLVMGLIQPDRGSVRIFGQPATLARGRIGYLAQHSGLDLQFPINVLQVVLMGRLGHSRQFGPFGLKQNEYARASLDEVGLADFAQRPFSALSGGQRQRVLIARALACEPSLLVLDEPTSNLDLAAQNDLHELLHTLNQRISLLVVAHDMAFVSKYVKTVVCVNRRVVVHAAQEIAGEWISDLYGRDMRMIMHDHDHGHAHPHGHSHAQGESHHKHD